MPGKDAKGQHAEAGGSCTPHRRRLFSCGDDGGSVGLAGQAAGSERGRDRGA